MQLIGQKRVQKERNRDADMLLKVKRYGIPEFPLNQTRVIFILFTQSTSRVSTLSSVETKRGRKLFYQCALLSSPVELFLFYNTSISIFPSSSFRSTFDCNNTNNKFQPSCPNLVPINQLNY